ncbi:class IV adenylate cyclase [Desulfocurvus sp. DL9XJH121]
MPMETELKYLDADLDAVRSSLHALGADFQARRFETNEVFDDAKKSLSGRGVLVRLRSDGRNILTLKQPPDEPVPQGVKAMLEEETQVDDPWAVRALFTALGLRRAFSYEKLREEWEYGGCHICLDHLPFGDFVEIEGEPEALRAAARDLGLDALETSTANYHQLNREHRARLGLPHEDGFAFDPDEAERLRA